jgi:hypothetical protein
MCVAILGTGIVVFEDFFEGLLAAVDVGECPVGLQLCKSLNTATTMFINFEGLLEGCIQDQMHLKPTSHLTSFSISQLASEYLKSILQSALLLHTF